MLGHVKDIEEIQKAFKKFLLSILQIDSQIPGKSALKSTSTFHTTISKVRKQLSCIEY